MPTTILSVGQKTYNPGILGPFRVTVPDGSSFLEVRLSNVNWPAGNVAKFTCEWTDGDTSFATVEANPVKGYSAIGFGVPAGVVVCDITVEVLQRAATAVTAIAYP